MKIKVKKDIFYSFLVYLIMFSAIIMPWYNNGKYNQDLMVLIVYLNTIFENTTILESFNDNVFIIYLIRTIFFNVSSTTLIFIIHNISVLLLTFTLKKYLKPIYVCSIMLFCFFTVFCNQFRLALSLSIALRGFMIINKNKKKGTILLIISLLLHFFVGSFIIGILLVEKYYKSANKVKLFIMTLLLSAIVLIYLYVISNPRFLLYLVPDDTGYISTTFILIAIAVFLLYKSIDQEKKLYVLIILFLVILSSSLSNISSRMGEMLFLTLPFLSIDSINNKWLITKSGQAISYLNKYLYFFLGLIFFLYRFINWVIFDKVIRPEILDNF